MKTTITIDEYGNTHSSNWMLDHIIVAFEKRGINNDSNNELIKELAIQKIEYGRTCIAQFLAYLIETPQTINSYWQKLDGELQNKIVEIGGEPKKIKLYNQIKSHLDGKTEG